MSPSRVLGNTVELNKSSLLDFFDSRAERAYGPNPLTSILYQDNNPELAKMRDKYEREFISPKLNLNENSRVIDIGCGIGRWADNLLDTINKYHGIDFSEKLILAAQDRFAGNDNITFQTLAAQDVRRETLPSYNNEFDVAIISGVIIYLNDYDVECLLSNIINIASNNFTLYIREPFALQQRLTLDNFYSSELGCSYSAIYRTKVEFEIMLNNTLLNSGFHISKHATLYADDNLNNRAETKQFYYIIKRC
jgi:SAM-dependent methyltransferase